MLITCLLLYNYFTVWAHNCMNQDTEEGDTKVEKEEELEKGNE
jgi:hypothetical protein